MTVLNHQSAEHPIVIATKTKYMLVKVYTASCLTKKKTSKENHQPHNKPVLVIALHF